MTWRWPWKKHTAPKIPFSDSIDLALQQAAVLSAASAFVHSAPVTIALNGQPEFQFDFSAPATQIALLELVNAVMRYEDPRG